MPVHDDQRTAITMQKQTVSPIKIVNKNSVHKVSKLSQEEIENVISDSEFDESPARVFRSSTGHNTSYGARRNLNSSLNEAGDSVLVGSIVVSPNHKENELKMTIKMTRKEK